MMFEAMAFKFCPLHIKLSTSNSKRACRRATSPFFLLSFVIIARPHDDFRQGWVRRHGFAEGVD